MVCSILYYSCTTAPSRQERRTIASVAGDAAAEGLGVLAAPARRIAAVGAAEVVAEAAGPARRVALQRERVDRVARRSQVRLVAVAVAAELEGVAAGPARGVAGGALAAAVGVVGAGPARRVALRRERVDRRRLAEAAVRGVVLRVPQVGDDALEAGRARDAAAAAGDSRRAPRT